MTTPFPTGFPARYSFRRKLAEGGMGAVYVAFDGLLGRDVAIKVIRPDRLGADARSERAKARFSREAQLMARVKHPACVPVYDAGFADGQPFLVMDFVAGSSLAQVIEEAQGQGGLATERVVRWGRVLAEALQACHDVGVVHRDVKPANVLIDHNDLPRLTDFGVARDEEARTQLTAEAAPIGTLAYMPPEQAEGLPGLRPNADVYSLGVTLYEALTGQLPFKAQGYVPLLGQILSEDPQPLRRVRGEIPPDLEVVVMACLEKAPEDRYPDAQALAADLGRVLRGDSIARQAGRWGRLRRRVARSRRLVVLCLAVLLLFGGVLASASLIAQRVRVNSDQADLSAARRVCRESLAGDVAAIGTRTLRNAESVLRRLSVSGATPELCRGAELSLRELAGVRLIRQAELAVNEFANEADLDRQRVFELQRIAGSLSWEERVRAVTESPMKQRLFSLANERRAQSGRIEAVYAQADRLLAQAEGLVEGAALGRLRAALHEKYYTHLSGWAEGQAERHGKLAAEAYRRLGLTPPASLSQGSVRLRTSPPAAWRLERYSFDRQRGLLVPSLVAEGNGDLSRGLEAGDYRVSWSLAGYAPLSLPFSVRRGVHLVRDDLGLTPERALGPLLEDLVALPGGRSPKLQEDHEFARVQSFLLGRTEVSLEAWFSWLVATRQQAHGRWAAFLEPGCDRQLAAFNMRLDQAEAYILWFGKEVALYGINGRLSLPSSDQLAWAVRGSLAWRFPWGNTYDYSFVGRGADIGVEHLPVGSVPADCSPFGVRDLAGSCHEYVISRGPFAFLYGGARYNSEPTAAAMLAVHTTTHPEAYGVGMGFRLAISQSSSSYQLPTPDPQRAADLFAEASRVYGQGDTWQAMLQVSEALEYDNSRWDLFLGRSQLRRELGDTYGSYLDATQATLLDPTARQAWKELAMVQGNRRQWQEVEVAAVRMLEMDPNDLDALALRADAREELGDLAGAHADYARWLNVAPPEASQLRTTIKERWEASAPR